MVFNEKWKRFGTTATQGHNSRVQRYGHQRRIVRKKNALLGDSVTAEFQTFSVLPSTQTLGNKNLNGMGFHDCAAAYKPYITKDNAKR